MEYSKSKKISVRKQLKSFSYAFNGLKILFKEEHNARIHLIVSVFVILLGIILGISATEWLVVSALIGLVLGLETINSAIENLCDFISPQKNNAIKRIKDLAAAAVFIAAIASVVCGSIIFIPKLYNLIYS